MRRIDMEKSFETQVSCKALKMQQHDFINHLQVIQSYLQMNKTDKALFYLDKVVDEVASLDSIDESSCRNSYIG
ncbi:Spo0B domain-containing protein [Anaerosinus sp.]